MLCAESSTRPADACQTGSATQARASELSDRLVTACSVADGRRRHGRSRRVARGEQQQLGTAAGSRRVGVPLNSTVGRAQQDEHRGHLSAKSSMSKMATCRSESSWKKKFMLPLEFRHRRSYAAKRSSYQRGKRKQHGKVAASSR